MDRMQKMPLLIASVGTLAVLGIGVGIYLAVRKPVAPVASTLPVKQEPNRYHCDPAVGMCYRQSDYADQYQPGICHS